MPSRIMTALAALTLCFAPLTVAHAQFGGIVYDPRNHAQNLLTAARTLQQINNQVRQLANEARLLAYQAESLAGLPTSVAGELQASIAEIDALVQSARGLAYEIAAIERAYENVFRERYDGATNAEILGDAREAWALAREGFQHSLIVQAEVTSQLRADAMTLDRLIAESQGAVGHLQAAQAGNQLTALSAKQTMQLQSLFAASARADALARADAVAERERARARFSRFMGDGDAYERN